MYLIQVQSRPKSRVVSLWWRPDDPAAPDTLIDQMTFPLDTEPLFEIIMHEDGPHLMAITEPELPMELDDWNTNFGLW